MSSSSNKTNAPLVSVSDGETAEEVAQRQDDLKTVEELETEKRLAFYRNHGAVMLNGKACVAYRAKDAATGQYKTRLTGYREMENHYAHVTVTLKEKEVPIFSHWKRDMNRKVYSDAHFRPVAGLVAGNMELPDGDVLNLYQGLAIEPREGECGLILSHIWEVWCSQNEVLYYYVMGWLARMFQVPNEQGHTVLLLQSGQGTGKNIIIDMLVDAFGEHATVADRTEDIVGKFNDHLATSVLVFANEAIWGGNKETEGALKALITDRQLPVERKFLPKFRVRNCCHLIMASNNDWAAPIGIDDRRYCVIEVSDSRVNDREYFDNLAAEIENGGREAFIHYLLNWPIAGFNPRKLPDVPSQRKVFAQLQGADTILRWWADVLTECQIGDRQWVDTITVDKGELYTLYRRWCIDMGINRPQANVWFARRLLELCPEAVATRLRGSEGRQRVYLLPELGRARQQLERLLKQPGPWAAKS